MKSGIIRRRWRTLIMAIVCGLAQFSNNLLADEAVLTPKRAVDIALAENPGLAEIKARAEAMAAIPSQEGSLPDPTLSFGALWLPVASGLDLNRDDFTMMEVGVSQSFPFPGKLALKEKAASLEAEAVAETVEEARLQLVREVTLQWWQLFSLHHTLQIIGETEERLKQLAEIADRQYRVGKGLQQDVLSAFLEQTKLAKEKAQHIGMHRTAIARLNALLNRSADHPIQLPEEADIELPDIRSVKDLQGQSELSRPLLVERKKAIDAAQTRLELAKKDYFPDFTLGTAYSFRQNNPNGQPRSDYASFQLSMTLPIYADRKQAKAVDQRQSELLKERYALIDAERKIQADINEFLAVYQGSREQFNLLKNDALPLAEQTISASVAAYQVGKTDFQSVIRAQNAWFDYRNQYWQALTEAHQALARLAAAVGKEAL
jgi:cobalt-zinc-cadmium efflux system outer membrane protein